MRIQDLMLSSLDDLIPDVGVALTHLLEEGGHGESDRTERVEASPKLLRGPATSLLTEAAALQ